MANYYALRPLIERIRYHRNRLEYLSYRLERQGLKIKKRPVEEIRADERGKHKNQYSERTYTISKYET